MISIIIPVYNTPVTYLKRCFHSLCSQTYNDFEAIIIDDGSESEYANQLTDLLPDERFVLFHQKNTGVSGARNAGIEYAKGEYITFVDADDYVSPDFLKSSLELMMKYDASIVLGGISIVNGKSSKNCGISGDKELVLNSVNKIQRYFLTAQYEKDSAELKGLRCGGPWCKLYRANVIENVRFRRNIPIYEDMIFNLEAVEQADKVIISPHIWYYYLLYPESAMRKFRPDGIAEQFRVMDFLLEYRKQHPELKQAISKKTGECIRKILTATLYHEQSDIHDPMKRLSEVFHDERVKTLLSDMDITLYPALPKKEKNLYNMCARRQVFFLHASFSANRIIKRYIK